MSKYNAYVGHTSDNLSSDVRTALDAVNWTDQVKSGSTVFIKPNFTFYEHRPGVTTTTEVLKELIILLKERAGRIVVGESDGANKSFTADQAFRGHGLIELADTMDFELTNLSNISYVEVEENILGERVKVLLPNLLINEIDTFISVPVLKVHAMTQVSLSIKNLWGCYPDTMRCLHHQNLSRKLALITKYVNPRLILIDGTYALDEHGPMYGKPKRVDLLISSDNPVVADTVGTNIMSMDLKRVQHILFAEREGLGTTDLNQVRINQGWKANCVQCEVNRTLNDKLSTFLFKSEFLAKLVMDSPLKPFFYSIVENLRNEDEQIVAKEIDNYRCK